MTHEPTQDQSPAPSSSFSLQKWGESIRDSATRNRLLALTGTTLIGSFFLYQKIKPRVHPTVPPLTDEWHPFLGNLKWFLTITNENFYETMHTLLNETHKDEPIVSLAAPNGRHMYVLNDPKLIKYVYSEAYGSGDFMKRDPSSVERAFELLGSPSIFHVDGKEWRFHRKVASRMFSLRNLKDYMYECAVGASERLILKMNELKEEPMDINDLLGRFTLDSFVEIAFGKSLGIIETAPRPHEFGTAFDMMVKSITQRTFDPLWRLKKGMNVGNEAVIRQNWSAVIRFIDELMDLDRRRKMVDEGGENINLISLYLKHDPKLKLGELRSIAQSFVIAGRDTTRMLLSWFFATIHKYPDYLEKIQSEIDTITEISYNAVAKEMPFTEKCLLETLRLYPSVMLSRRACQRDSFQLAGKNGQLHEIKKHELVMIIHWAQGRNPRIFKDPLSFNPDRWTKGLKTFDESEYVVFHQAPRICLGRTFALLEAKILIWHFLRAFTYKPVSSEMPKPAFGGVTNMKDGFFVNIQSKQ